MTSSPSLRSQSIAAISSAAVQEVVISTFSILKLSSKKLELTEWSEDGMTFTDQPLGEGGAPQGEVTRGKATWSELRDHALFPAATARRERAERDTALGKLAGWLYTVPCGEGCASEFFFADATPGSPVDYSQTRDGQLQMRAEVVERHRPSPSP